MIVVVVLSRIKFFTNRETSTYMCMIENQRVNIDLLFGPLYFKVLFEGPVISSQADVKRHYIVTFMVDWSVAAENQNHNVWSLIDRFTDWKKRTIL